MNPIVVSKEGLKELEDKLYYLKNTATKENADHIALALSYGDLSENAEYSAAKEEQSKLMTEIAELEDTILHAIISDEDAGATGKVGLGSTVTVLYVDDNEEETYNIIGARQTAKDESHISIDSPIGAALMGKVAGEAVNVEVPDGVISLKIINVARNN